MGIENSKAVARLRNSLTEGNLWLYILALAKRRKIYAYVLDEKIRKAFGFMPNKIMLYIVLYKLEKEALLASEYVQRRKYYKLTEKGKHALKTGLGFIRTVEKKLGLLGKL